MTKLVQNTTKIFSKSSKKRMVDDLEFSAILTAQKENYAINIFIKIPFPTRKRK